MSVSVVDPIGPAISWTKRVLFQPFDLVKWLAVGFSAWLASLGEGGANFNLRVNVGDPNLKPVMDQASNWVKENLGLVIALGVSGLLLVLALWLLFTWLSSRGKFMFLDNVVRNRQEIREPWALFIEQGNSLTGFRIVLGLLAFLSLAIVLGISALPFIPSLQAGEFLPSAIAGIFLAVFLGLAWAVVLGCISLFLGDFVIPIMYMRRCRVMEAWREFRVLLGGYPGNFAIYVLFKIAIGMIVGVLAIMVAVVLMLLTCGLLCCVSAIPLIGSLPVAFLIAVAVLPLSVFLRTYPLYYLAQFHPNYRLLPEDPSHCGQEPGA